MIHKSFLVEDNINLLKNNTALFYGENTGLINDFKKKITEEIHKYSKVPSRRYLKK